MALTPGTVVLDRYRIERLLGSGGMGEVYRARHERLDMPVAIKVVTAANTPEMAQRFEREAVLLARVRHPNIVSILDVGLAPDGAPCMAMELLEGESLEGRRKRMGALPWTETRTVGLSVLRGLDAIHAAGIVHRDIKPANIFIAAGTPPIVKLLDFGVAAATGPEAARFTRTGAIVGTPAFMSPEQLVGAPVDARSDLYSLALSLYEISTGQLPFGDDPGAALRRINEPVPTPVAPRGLPRIPVPMAVAIRETLAVKMEDRPRSARELFGKLKIVRKSTRRPVPTTSAPPAAVPSPLPGLGLRGTSIKPPSVWAATSVAPAAPPAAPPRPPATARDATHPLPPLPPMPGPTPRRDEATGRHPTQAAQRRRAPSDGQVCALLAAKLPLSRMSRSEAQALAHLAAPGRSYHLGEGVWCALMPAASRQASQQAAERLRALLRERYGEHCKVLWRRVREDFGLPAASLTGTAPLPKEVKELLERLA
ncbi:MAG: serine/threonine protein kinase [Myxococcales bacterium]|nr:serine/threonine protein kinase [Myxococcales bacterium]